MLKKIIDYIKEKRDILYIIPIIVLSLLLFNKCNNNNNLKQEVVRLENNILAAHDTLQIYKDDYGNVIGEKHAYQLKSEELNDSIKRLITKNRELISYLSAGIEIRDTVEVPTYIERTIERTDTIYFSDQGVIRLDKIDVFDKSSRELHVQIPYVYDDELITYPATIDLTQDIFIEGMIERDKKTQETYVKLISDYPLTFNRGEGVMITNSRSYEKSLRKTKGIGFSLGPQIGLSYDLMNRRITPTLGVGLTIGFNYTPKFLQW